MSARLVLGNTADGGKPANGRLRMFRSGDRWLGTYEYDTLDLSKFSDIGGKSESRHVEVDEVQRFFDRAGRGEPGVPVSDPRMTTGADKFIVLDRDDEYPNTFYSRQKVDTMLDSADGSDYRTNDSGVKTDETALTFRLTQVDNDEGAYFDNSKLLVSSILWEFSPSGGRGRWYQMYEMPNTGWTRITLPDPTNRLRVRAISNNPEEWVQAMAITTRVDYQNRYISWLHWYIRDLELSTTDPDVASPYVDLDDMFYLSWPEAMGGRGEPVYRVYWSPGKDDPEEEWQLLKTDKKYDLRPDEYPIAVEMLGGWLHISASDILDTIYLYKRVTMTMRAMEVLLDPEKNEYTGWPITPRVTVRSLLTRVPLGEEHYYLTWENNIMAGRASVTATGIDYYTDYIIRYFIIDPCPIWKASVVSVHTWGNMLPYTWGELLERNWQGVLMGDDDGEGLVVVNGHTWFDLLDETWRDLLVDTWRDFMYESTTVSENGGFYFTGYEIRPQFMLMYYGLILSHEDYYIEGYYDNVNVGTARIHVIGRRNFCDERYIEFEIMPAEITHLILSETVTDYDGKVHTPDVTVRLRGYKLTEGVDYEIEVPEGRKNHGVYVYRVWGIGNLTGYIEAAFTINMVDLATCKMEEVPKMLYTGSEVKPHPFVRANDGNGRLLMPDVDFYYSWIGDNVNLGTATVMATGIDNYYGSISQEFEITYEGLEFENWDDISAYPWDVIAHFTWDELSKGHKIDRLTLWSDFLNRKWEGALAYEWIDPEE